MPSLPYELSLYESFGPQSVGAKLLINPDPSQLRVPDVCTFDLETDGSAKQVFVGIAICPSLDEVWYFTELNSVVKEILTTSKLIAHNVKSDLQFAKREGFAIPSSNIYADTSLMSYCIDSTKRKHGLKQLCFERYGHQWPSYEDMTEGGSYHLGLQPVEKVAAYCGRDAWETLYLFYDLLKQMTPAQRKLHWLLELPEALILAEREAKGVMVDVEKLKALQAQFGAQLEHLEAHLINVGKDIGFKHSFEPNKKGKVRTVDVFNPNSPQQGVTFFNMLGIEVDNVKEETMEDYYGNKVVDTFAEYKHLAKFKGTYIDGMLSIESLPFVHTNFNQTVTITGRLSSSEPNLQNIPRSDEDHEDAYGNYIRDCFIARPGYTFIDADFSNMELRVAAHFSNEPVWLEAFNANKDVHKASADKIGKSRSVGKLFNLSVVYGVGPRKLAKSLGCSVKQAERELDNYWKGLKTLHDWIENTKRQARKAGFVRTLMGRVIHYPALKSSDKWQREEAERQAVNAIVQGSSAEISKLADLALHRAGVLPLLSIHDEFLVEILDSSDEVSRVSEIVKTCMENAVSLKAPLVCDIGTGKSWFEAKK